MIIRHTDSNSVSGIWIKALKVAMDASHIIAAVREEQPELADDAPERRPSIRSQPRSHASSY
jgi:hypothetical protein